MSQSSQSARDSDAPRDEPRSDRWSGTRRPTNDDEQQQPRSSGYTRGSSERTYGGGRGGGDRSSGQDERSERVNRHYTDDRQRGRSDQTDRWGSRGDSDRPSHTDNESRRFPPRGDNDEQQPRERRFERSDRGAGGDDRPPRRFDDRQSSREPTSRDQVPSEDRPAHLRFNRAEGGAGAAQGARSGRSLADLEREKYGSRDSLNASPQPSVGSNDNVSDATQRMSLNDRRTAAERTAPAATAAPAQTLQPVKLGKGDGQNMNFAERLAQRKAAGAGGDRLQDDRQDSRSSRYGGDRFEDRQQAPGSRFARAEGEERYGAGRSERGGGYGAGRFDNDRGSSGYGSRTYGNRDVGELPTGPSARMSEAEYEAPKPKPKILAAAVAQKTIDPSTLSQRYDSDSVKLDVMEKPKTVNVLQQAIDGKTSVTDAQLAENIVQFDLAKNNQAISDVIVRSINDKKMTFKQSVDAVTTHVTGKSEQATLLTTVLASYASRKDDGQMQQLVKDSQIDILPIIAPGVSGAELDNYLDKHGLIRLKPVTDISGPVNEALSANKSATDVMSIIDGSIDSKLTAANVRPAISAYVSKQVFSKTGAVKSDILTEWSPVLKRVVLKARDEQIALVRELVTGWYGAGFPKQQLREAFVQLYNNKIISAEAFKGWQEDIKDRSASKMKALLQIGGWLSELQVSNKEQEVEDSEEDEDDDLATNPNLDD